MIGISELFDELSRAEADDFAYQFAAEQTHDRIQSYRIEYRSDPVNRAKAVERMRQWRLANPERYRVNRKLWKKRNPEKWQQIQNRRRLRWQAANPERAREMYRRNSAAYRERKRAAAGVVAGPYHCRVCGESGHNSRRHAA